VGGYVKTDEFNDAFLTGVINPFGPSSQAGLDALNGTRINDAARKSRGTTTGFDVRGSRDLFAMEGGPAAIALGYEFRREELEFRPSELLQAGQIRGDGPAVAFDGSRNVNAIFGELNLPVFKTLEAQLALRHDRYSDAGNTTNPKVGLRWTPMREVLVRGSYGEGFRAPTLADLYTPERVGQTNGIYDDIYCAQAVAIDPGFEPDYCGLQPDKRVGGSSNLKPEKSKQWSAGIVFQPLPSLSTSIDYWRIEKSNTIVSPEGQIFADQANNASSIVRDAPFPELGGIPGPILEIDGRLRNAGELQTSGIDLSLEYRGPMMDIGRFSVFGNGTYVINFETKDFAGGQTLDGLGRFAGDQVVQRWRHSIGGTYDFGPASVTLIQTYLRGYTDQNPNPDGSSRRVDSYQLWDLTGSYAFNSAFKLRAGVKNLFDEEPPVSNQVYSFLAGFDPNYTDPRGRFFFISGQYSFR
jgi:iron complex outermembrane receptor protein